MRSDVGEGWTIDLPGEMEVAREGDGSFVAWDDRRTLRASTAATSGYEDGTPVEARTMLGSHPGEIVERDGGMLVQLGESRDEVEDGQAMRTRHVRAATPNQLLLLSFFTLDGDEQWTAQVAATVERQPG